MAWDIGAFEYQESGPTAVDDDYTLTAGSTYNVNAPGVLTNDTYVCAEMSAFDSGFYFVNQMDTILLNKALNFYS